MRIGTATLERWTAAREAMNEPRDAGSERNGPSAGSGAGAGFMLLAMAGFTFNDAMIKGLDGALPATQVIAVRGVMLIGLIMGWFAVRARSVAGAVPVLQATRRAVREPLVLARSGCETLATVAFLIALTQLPFAVISAMLQSMPLLVTAGAALFLSERVGWRRWLAILAGLVGVLIILRPGGAAFADSALLLAVACVLLSAGRDLCTRRIPVDVPSVGVTMVSVVLMTACSLVWCTATGAWSAMSAAQLGLMAGAALFLFAGMQGIVLAMRSGEVSAVMPYRYTGLVWAVVIGWLLFAEVPDVWTLVGAGVVVGTGLYAFARERRLARQGVAQATPLLSR